MGICRAYGRLKEYHMLKFKDLKVGMRLRRLDNKLNHRSIIKDTIYEIKGIFPEDQDYSIISDTGIEEKFYFRENHWEISELTVDLKNIIC